MPGTMAAVLGLDNRTVSELCQEVAGTGVVVPANLNAPGQVVVSGEITAVRRFADAAKGCGAKRVIKLNVSAAFHSPLMEPVAAEFRRALKSAAFAAPAFPVISNVTSDAVTDPGRIRSLLVRQLTSPVCWTGCIERLKSLGVQKFAELGPGKVLTGLNRRNARGFPALSLGTRESIESIEGLE